ncbi:ATP-dependent RNA helicase DHX30-like isoform X2 [Athalia rosae]|nr:ATP-dependent RNA helicase DHX30-like isoform X2 [Athalia rosae]
MYRRLKGKKSLTQTEYDDINGQFEVFEPELNHTIQVPKSGLDSSQTRTFEDHDDPFAADDFLNTMDHSSAKTEMKIGRKHSQRKSQNVGAAEMSNTPTSVTFNHEKMEKQYPDARQVLNKVCTIVSTELKNEKYMINASYEKIDHKKNSYWQCTYNMLWPNEMNISATGKNKSAAANVAALKCLHYLQSIGKLRNGIPILYNPEQVSEILNKSEIIRIEPKVVASINALLQNYNQHIAPILAPTNSITGLNEIDERIIGVKDNPEDIHGGNLLPPINEMALSSHRLHDPLRETPLKKYSPDILNQRNVDLFQSLESQRFERKTKLPIIDYREDILSQLDDERVLLIKGEPGCGKSTQVPQFILDDFIKKGNGTGCNIIITQPRRISAISLAKRVAQERDEELGKSIGYQVRLQNVLPDGPSGGILFCSSGILLRKMQHNPNLLGCSHVVLDEAHERDLNTDVLLVLLSRALKKNPDLKLIIMSATLNAELFERYFNCNTISIPGFTYPVKMHFLEDILRLRISGINNSSMSIPNPVVNSEEMAHLIEWISYNKPPGAILCFLPGWSEILRMKRILEETLPQKSHIILPVHSRLPYSQQSLIFNRTDGVRKIILATNIAETSITIDDVVYVVDSCAHKEVRLQEDSGMSSIDNQWVSQGNINQRKGRAGRVQPGESFHFITKDKYESLDEFPTPEIMRAELQKAVLDCKTYTSEKVAEFFSEMPEPPRMSAVQLAVDELKDLGALDENEDLTALGKRISLFSIDPRLSKVMVYSVIFQCVSPIVTLASFLASDFEIFSDRLYDKGPIRKIKQNFQPASDHLALSWLYEQWNSYATRNPRKGIQFCNDAQIESNKMMLLKKLRSLYGEHLSQCRMLRPHDPWDDLNSSINNYARHDEFVQGVLLAGLDRVLHKKNAELKNGRLKTVQNVMQMQDGRRATLTPDSVNYNRRKWPSRYLTYQRHVHSSERRTTLIRESSLVSPLTVLLFCEGDITQYNQQKNGIETNNVVLTFQKKKNVKLILDSETAQVLLQLKKVLQNVIRYYIENQGLAENHAHTREIEIFKRNLIALMSNMLVDSDEEISYFEDENDLNVAKD